MNSVLRDYFRRGARDFRICCYRKISRKLGPQMSGIVTFSSIEALVRARSSPAPLPRSTPPARLAGLAARRHARLSARRPSPALERRRLPSPPAPAASQPRLARLCACHDSLPIAQPAPPGPRASPYQRPTSPSPRSTPHATPAPLSLILSFRGARRGSSRRSARLGHRPSGRC